MNTVGTGENGYPINRYKMVHILKSEHRALLADRQIAAHAKRLALELECLLLSADPDPSFNRWWESAHEALENYRADIDRLYPQDHVSPLGKD